MKKKIFAKKSIHTLIADSEAGSGLKKTLGWFNLTALGVGAIIGAGLFVRTAAAAGEAAGPAVTLSFIVAAIGCAFAGLCYAEFSSMIPIAGSAYTYAYATMGELVAWAIGWALILEYALGAATVSIAWSEYLNNLCGGAIPYKWCHSPFEVLHKVTDPLAIDQFVSWKADLATNVKNGVLILNNELVKSVPTELTTFIAEDRGIMNIPALVILGLLSLLLIRGTRESAMVNAVIVFVKVAIVLVFIAIGWNYINPENHTPYIVPANDPGHESFFTHGWGGILFGAGIVFFAFIGFDAVSTAAQEAKNPKRDMPIGILGSLAICTVLYILFAHVLTGVADYHEFTDPTKGKEASVSYAITHHMPGYEWLGTAVTIAILAGFSSVILVMLMGQSRVFFSMANDGLLPKMFAAVHPRFATPYKSNIMLFFFVGIFSAFVPGSVAGDLTSIGTLFAFVLVCAGVWIMRVSDPQVHRPFKTPLVPLVPILGILVCSAMIISLPSDTQLSALFWMIIGLAVYFLYGQHHSKLHKSKSAQ